jgi:crotonobetainyl-CoA:carnitine CoA-transferase CaiB-like acyl-CoA transferase
MTEGSLALLAAEFGNLDCGAKPTRGTEMLNGGAACYGIYRTKDDRYLSVGALEPKFWTALNQAIGRPPNVGEIVGKPDEQTKVKAELAEIFATKTAAEWTEFFAKRDCLVELVLEPEEVPHHPLHRAREVFFEIETGSGPIMQVRTPIGRPANASPAPRLGEHSRSVLVEYGLSDAEITALGAA